MVNTACPTADMTRYRAYFGLCAALLLGGAACHLDDLVRCKPTGVIFQTRAYFPSQLWVGDSQQLEVFAMSDPSQGCETDFADSRKDPTPFTFSVDNAGVATVSPTGLVTAKGPGKAGVGVQWTNQHLVHEVNVTLPVSAIHITPSRDTVALNDTVSVSAEALDAAGNPIPDAPLSLTQIFAVNSYTTRYLQPIAPYTGRQFRFVASISGNYSIVLTSPRTAGTGRTNTARVIVR